MAKDKFSPNNIPNKNVDWGVDQNDDDKRPYSGTAIQKFLKDTLNSKVGCMYEDTSNDMYLFFADEDECEKYLSDSETYANLLMFSMPMQKLYTAEINVTSATSDSFLLGTKGKYLDFTFDIKNRQGSSSGDDVVVTYTFTSDAGGTKTFTEMYANGTSVHLCVDDYLVGGTNRLKISLRGQTTLAATTQSVTYNVISLSMSTEFEINRPYSKGESFSFYVRAQGYGTKYIETYLDGVDITDNSDDITAYNGNILKSISLPSNISSGKHNLQMRAFIASGLTKYYTKTYSYDFAVSGGNVPLVLFATELSEPMSSVKITATQYQEVTFQCAIYDPSNRKLSVDFIANNDVFAKRSLSNGDVETIGYTPIIFGSSSIVASVNNVDYSLNVDIAKSNISMTKATSGLILELTAKGRSNSDASKNVWTSGSYSATFNNVAFNNQCGWVDDALVLSGNAKVDVNIAPLATNVANSGFTLELDYEVDNGNTDDDAQILNLLNDQGEGILITPTYVLVKSADGKEIKHLRMTGTRKKIAIVINRNTVDKNKGIFHTISDGAIGYVQNYTASSPFACSKSLSIGDTTGSCKVRIYSIRIYNRALSLEEELGNFGIESGDVASVANQNDVFVDGTERVSFDKTKLKVASMRITGNIQRLLEVQNKTTTITADVEFYDPDNINNYWKAVGVTIKNQGTSTLKFPLKNFTLNFSAAVFYDYLGNQVQMTGIKLHNLSVAVKKAVAKCDYMESSASFNTAGAISYNDTGFNTAITNASGQTEYPLRTAAQKYAVEHGITTDIRSAIDGIPVAMFYKLTEESDEVCIGQYNLNNGKDDCPEAYGFKDLAGYNASNTERWELAEEDGLCCFTAASYNSFDSNYGKYFECVFPSTTQSPAKLKRLVGWLASLDNGNGTYKQTKFDNEYTQYLDPWKCAHYYNHIFVKNIGVDQAAKNMHLVTEDGITWFPVYYDGDSAKLNDNDGYQFGKVYNASGAEINPLYVDRQSKDANGNYVFQGHDSVLWNCIEGSSSFMAIVKQDIAAEYSHGFNYDSEVQTYITKHTARFPQRIINQNAEAKYLAPYRSGVANYLYVSQGAKDERIRLIADRRLKRYEALWCFGGYSSRALNFRLNTGNNVAAGRIKIKAFADYWFGYSSNLNMVGDVVRLSAGQSHEFTAGVHANGDILRIHATDQISEIDMSELMTGLYSVEANNTYSNESTTHLVKFVLSDGVSQNTTVTQINGLNKLTALEYLDIRNYKGITAIEQLPMLKTLLAAGSSLAVFHPADGASLTLVSLPDTITDIEMKDVAIGTFNYTPNNKLNRVKITGSSDLDLLSFVKTWLAAMSNEQKEMASLTVDNILWNLSIDEMLSLCDIGAKNIRGRINVSGTMTMELYNKLVATFGSSCFNPDAVLYIHTNSAVFIRADKTTLASGEGTSVSGYSLPGGETINYRLYVNDVAVDVVDGKATYNGATLDCSTGAITTTEVGQDFVIKVTGYVGETESTPISISVTKTIRPTAISIVGDNEIVTTGDHSFTISVTPSNYTIGINSVNVTIEEV